MQNRKNDNDILGFHGENRWLSNFEPCLVYLDNVGYASVEHAYQAAKTMIPDQRAAIRSARHASLAKSLGRRVTTRHDWNDIRVDTMETLLMQKFQSDPFRDKLLATGDAYIEETNCWGDTFWGVYNGLGLNHLGQALMRVRERIKAQA